MGLIDELAWKPHWPPEYGKIPVWYADTGTSRPACSFSGPPSSRSWIGAGQRAVIGSGSNPSTVPLQKVKLPAPDCGSTRWIGPGAPPTWLQSVKVQL